MISGAVNLSDLPAIGARLLAPVATTLLSLGSSFSLVALLSALAIAAAHLVGRRRARGRRTSLALLVRLLFPKSIWRHPSTKADLGFLLLNFWVTGIILAGGLWSGSKISFVVGETLRRFLGAAPLGETPGLIIVAVGTVAGYLAYELGYWIDHYLSHKVPAFWAIHKVHHTAEVLTPLTVFRVHPLESLKFHNILAVTLGTTNGVALYVFGPGPHVMMIFGQNAIMVVFFLALVNLQHSHAWMTFGGGLGRLFASPAHHQIHHSADPRHFGKNFGSFLTIWDKVFGTLYTPDRERPKNLKFGTPALEPHGVTGGLITPMVEAVVALKPSPLRRRVDAGPARDMTSAA